MTIGYNCIIKLNEIGAVSETRYMLYAYNAQIILTIYTLKILQLITYNYIVKLLLCNVKSSLLRYTEVFTNEKEM